MYMKLLTLLLGQWYVCVVISSAELTGEECVRMAGSVQLTTEELCDGLDQLCIHQLELMDQLIKVLMT